MHTALNAPQLQEALRAVKDPHTGNDFVSTRQLAKLEIQGQDVSLEVVLPYPARSAHGELSAMLQRACEAAGAQRVTVQWHTQIIAHGVQRGVALLPRVKNIVAVASGKGGVGKSTTAVNLALALHAEGAAVGLLDADIYGPSLPTMMGIAGKPSTQDGKTMEPLTNHGLEVMSIGFLVDREQAMIWRGPMATQALEQLLRQTNWGELDYLIVDLPPGTGDIQLTLSQRAPLTGALIVTTPQDIALLDAVKGVRMFEKVNIPILGVVENMASHVCSNCSHVEPVFGADGGKKIATQYGLPYLGALPLEMQIRLHADAGTPIMLTDPQGEIARTYREIAIALAVNIAALPKDYSSRFAPVTVERSTQAAPHAHPPQPDHAEGR